MPGTRLYSPQGTLRSEDHQVRSVARSRIDSALAELEHKYDALASQLALKTELAFFTDAGDIVDRVRAHSWLEGEFATLNRYIDSFPEMRSYVDGKLAQIERHTRRLVALGLRPTLHSSLLDNNRDTCREVRRLVRRTSLFCGQKVR